MSEECATCEEYVKSLQELKREFSHLRKQYQELTTVSTKMEQTLRKNNLLDKIMDISNVEAICIEQIQKLKEKSSMANLTESEIKMLDVLHRNLNISQGHKDGKDSKAVKGLSEDKLLEFCKAN